MHVNIHMYECILIRVTKSRDGRYTTVAFSLLFNFLQSLANRSIPRFPFLTRDNDRGLFLRIIIRFLSRSLETPRFNNPRVRHASMWEFARTAPRPNAHSSWSWPHETKRERKRGRERDRASFSRVRIVTQLTYVTMRTAYLSLISIRANNSFYEAARSESRGRIKRLNEGGSRSVRPKSVTRALSLIVLCLRKCPSSSCALGCKSLEQFTISELTIPSPPPAVRRNHSAPLSDASLKL